MSEDRHGSELENRQVHGKKPSFIDSLFIYFGVVHWPFFTLLSLGEQVERGNLHASTFPGGVDTASKFGEE